jgi:hypothetical protein
MESSVAEEGGPQQIETLPGASNMAPSNAGAESGTPGARDEEEGGDAGTKSNDAEGGKQRKPRRPKMVVQAEKLHKAEADVAKKQVCCRPMESEP